MSEVFFDIETRSTLDLRTSSITRYITHPSTNLMCAVWKRDGKFYAWTCQPIELPGIECFSMPFFAIGPIIKFLAEDAKWIAHNGNMFDRPFWENTPHAQPEFGWEDTLQLARLYGLPGGLDRVSSELIGEHKLGEEQKIMKKYMKKPEDYIPEPEFREILRYCVQDVELLSRIYVHLKPMAGFESELREADYSINKRGFAVDSDRAIDLTKIALTKRDEAVAEAEKLGVGLRQLRSPKALKEWFNDRGHEIENTRRETLETISGKDEEIVISAREQASRPSFGKFRYIIKNQVEGRLHFQYAYHQAHTGRWGARGFQAHNLPRWTMKEADIAAALEDLSKLDFKDKSPGEVLANFVRPCIVAAEGKELFIRDYKQVEVRGVDWCAGDYERLREHENDEDAYINAVRDMFHQIVDKKHPLRQGIKPVVLGCGYGMGPVKLIGYAEGMGIDLALTGKTAEELVRMYRDAHPLIAGAGPDRPGLWKNLERACIMAIKNRAKVRAGNCRFYKDGNCLIIALPSGRPLVYRKARVERVDGPWGKTDRIIYWSNKGYWDDLYGGKLTENIVQAICRDIFAEAIVRCHKAGLQIVMHSHDEIVIESDSEQEAQELQRLMDIRPTWGEDFPVASSGVRSKFFVK